MSQVTSQSAPNSGGSTFRANVNNILAALFSASSGASAPATTVGGQFWLDTGVSPPVLRVRNTANTAWIVVTPETITANTLRGNPTGSAAAEGEVTMSQLRTMLEFAQSLAASGYWRLGPAGSGVLIQKGIATTAGDANATITFPTAFANTNYRIIGQHRGTGFCVIIQDSSFTKSATQVRLRALNAAGSGIASVDVEWIAVGE